jgi:hypothetical protein
MKSANIPGSSQNNINRHNTVGYSPRGHHLLLIGSMYVQPGCVRCRLAIWGDTVPHWHSVHRPLPYACNRWHSERSPPWSLVCAITWLAPRHTQALSMLASWLCIVQRSHDLHRASGRRGTLLLSSTVQSSLSLRRCCTWAPQWSSKPTFCPSPALWNHCSHCWRPHCPLGSHHSGYTSLNWWALGSTVVVFPPARYFAHRTASST